MGIKEAIDNNDVEKLKECSNDVLTASIDYENGCQINSFMYACSKKDTDLNIIISIIEHALNKIFSNGVSEVDPINSPSGKEFLNFFYNSIEVNGIEYNAATFAFKNSNQEIIDFIGDFFCFSPVPFIETIEGERIKPKTQKETKKIFTGITKKFGEGQSSYFSSKKSVAERPPRIFTERERERQLLKQLSTVLYFFHKANQTKEPKAPYKNLVEIESMHLRIGAVSHLVISCNGGELRKKGIVKNNNFYSFFSRFKNMGDLQVKLNLDIKLDGFRAEAKNRVPRYQKILRAIFNSEKLEKIGHNGNSDEITQYRNVLELLNNQAAKIIKIDAYYDSEDGSQEPIKQLFSEQSPCVFIVNTNGDNATDNNNCPHAEEYLVEIFQAVRSYNLALAEADRKEIYSCIAGKKRPCMTCYATMFNAEVNSHGQRPGFAWRSALSSQRDNNKVISLLVLLQNQSHVTTEKLTNGASKHNSSYDSGSDDDEIKIEADAYGVVL